MAIFTPCTVLIESEASAESGPIGYSAANAVERSSMNFDTPATDLVVAPWKLVRRRSVRTRVPD